MPAAGEHRRGYDGWRVVATLAVTETISWGVLYYAFAVLHGPMAQDLDVSPAVVTGAFSLMLAVTGVAAVPAGRVLDRHGAHGLMTGGSVAAVALVVAWSQVTAGWQLYLVFAGLGLVSAAVLYEPAFAVAVQWFPEQRATALLVIAAVAGLASTIFLPLTQALVGEHGWRHAVLVLAALLATTVLPHAVVLRRHPPGRRPVPGLPESQPGWLRQTAGWAARDHRFRWLTVAFAANTLALVVVMVHLVPCLEELGHPAGPSAAAAGALGAVGVAGRVLLTALGRHWPLATVAATAFAAQAGAGILLLVFGGTTAGVLAFVLLFGLGFGVGTIARPTLIADAYGTARFATLSALLGVVLTVARTVGPVLGGVLRDVSGGYQAVLGIVVAASALAAVGLIGATGVVRHRFRAVHLTDQPRLM